MCRLATAKSFDVNSPQSLVGAGFASLGLAAFSFFRLSPFIMYIVLWTLRKGSLNPFYQSVCIIVIFSWMGLLMAVFVLLGITLLFSAKIKRREILILHPWGLLFLYFDVFIWMVMGSFLYSKIDDENEVGETSFEYLMSYIMLAFADVVFFCLIYYVYATYFIIVELTVIEKFYGQEIEPNRGKQSVKVA